MNKQKNQIIILLAVIFLGVLYAFIQYLFLPQWDILKEKSAHIAERQAYLKKLEENDKILSSLKDQALDLTAQVSMLDKKIPKKLDKPNIMLTIYSMAKNIGLSPKSLNYDPINDEGEFYSMGMNFFCAGSAENIYTFTEQFLNVDKYTFTLDSISISPGEGGVSANMRLVAYAYKE
jgi:type IV pilus assembly protein PilO